MLNIDFTFLFVLVNLAILYFILKKFLFGRLGTFMENRSAAIADDIKKGVDLKYEGEKHRSMYKEMLDGAEAERDGIIQSARLKASKEYDAMIASAKEESARIIKEAREEAEREFARLEKDLKSHAAELAILAASKIIEKNMDNEQNRDLVNRFINKEEAA